MPAAAGWASTQLNKSSSAACPSPVPGNHVTAAANVGARCATLAQDVPHQKRVIRGYKAQSEPVLAHVISAVQRAAASGQSVIVEGIHLAPRGISALAAQLQVRSRGGFCGSVS